MEKMSPTVAQTAVVDISKDMLDVHRHPDGTARRFSNNTRGFSALIQWPHTIEVTRVVFEPTGAYHHAFERSLAAAGLPLAKANPLQARRFAQAIGQRAKTDAVDAAMLARFGALVELPAQAVVSETLDSMKELLVARRALVKDRTASLSRDQTRRSSLLRRLADQRLLQVKRQVAAVDAALHDLCQTDPALKARFDILVSIPGIGEITALTMLIEMAVQR